MHLLIGGTKDVENQLRDWPTAIISAVNAPTSHIPECDVPHERLLLFFRNTVDFNDPSSFSIRHVGQFTTFAKSILRSHDPQRVIVHCHDGIAQSPALAYALLAMAYGESAAIDELLRLRPQATPNPLVVHRLAWAQPSRGPMWDTFEDVAHDLGWLPASLPRLGRLPEPARLAALAQVRPKVEESA